MEKELVQGNIGSGGGYAVKLVGASIVVEGDYKAGAFASKVELSLSAKDLLVLLKEKVPGKIDDMLIDFVLAELEKEKAA